MTDPVRLKSTTVVDGLVFPECPRWHDGALWFSDQHGGYVARLDPVTAEVEKVLEIDGQPSGLGWLPDGRMLVVSMVDRTVLRLDDGGPVVHADLSSLAAWHCNDMVVDHLGRAYVGNFGFDLDNAAERRSAHLALVDADGSVRLASGEDLEFPNGAMITPDGRTFIVGETLAQRYTAFDIEADGTLSNRRLWAQLDSSVPDGGCLDAEGAVWTASPGGNGLQRVLEGGGVTHAVEIEGVFPFACMLGDTDRRTLYICTAPTFLPKDTRPLKGGRIESVRVDVPGAGLP